MKHLLLTYAWSINNIGDMGIQAGMMELLKKQCPGLPVKLITYLPESDECYTHYRDALPEYNELCEVLPMPFFDLIGSDPLPGAASAEIEKIQVKGQAWANLQKRWSPVKLEQFRNGTLSSFEAAKLADDLLNRFSLEIFEDMKIHFPKLAAAFSDAGFVYYNSGTTLNFGRLGVRRLFGYTLPLAMSLLLARALHIPYGIGSQSFDLLEWPMDLIYETLFRDAEFVYCRDTDSLNYLHQKKFSLPSHGFRPDTTVFFNRADSAWADKYLAENGFSPEEYMIVILRMSTPDARYHDPTGGAVSVERGEYHLAQMKYLIENYIEKTGRKVLIAHETRDTLKDDKAKVYLYDRLSEKARQATVCMDFFWTPEQALAVFRKAALLVSVEMHSIIMGIGNLVPVLHTPYAECGRKRQMIRDMGLDKCLIDLDVEDSGAQMLAAALADPNKEQLREVRNDLERAAQSTIKEVMKYF